jgi:hypothetical protein
MNSVAMVSILVGVVVLCFWGGMWLGVWLRGLLGEDDE